MGYNPTTWQTGDAITAAKLNNIEGGVSAADALGVDLDQRVTELEKDSTAFDALQGELLHFPRSIDAPIRDTVIYGRSWQNGTPSPSSPAAIITAGSSGTLNVTACSKNLLKPNVQTQTKGTIVVTTGSDGRVTLSAGSYDGSSFSGSTVGYMWLPAGTYVFSGQNDVDPVNKLLTLQLRNETLNAQITNRSDGDDYEFTLNSPARIYVNVGFRAGATLSAPATMLPMIRKIGTESGFVPFDGTVFPVTVPSTGLPGVPVTSGGNYTDSTGQEWICDTIDLGKGVYTKRVRYVAPTDININEIGTTGGGTPYAGFSANGDNMVRKTNDPAILCSNYVVATTGQPRVATYKNTAGTNGQVIFYDTVFSNYENTQAGRTAASEYLANAGVTVIYAIATPIETALTAEQVAQLKAIATRKVETWMYNDGGSGMYVEGYTNEQAQIDGIGANLAPAYSVTGRYAVGAYVMQDGKLYRCVSAIQVPEGWTPAHWTRATVGEVLSDFEARIAALEG